MAEETRHYSVGGHIFSISSQSGDGIWKCLENCSPFEIGTVNSKIQERIFNMKITSAAMPVEEETLQNGFIAGFEGDGTYISLYINTKREYIFILSVQDRRGKTAGILHTDTDQRTAVLSTEEEATDEEKAFAANNALMLLYAINTSYRKTLLIHASAVVCDGKAYAFLGKSGTGKSTHSQLWVQYIKGSRLLNDDNPVIRIINGQTRIYGTPWSGKTPCYLNESHVLGALVKLEQAPENSIRRLHGLEAYSIAASSASSPKWERKFADGLHETLSLLTGNIPFYRLGCRADEQAATLCHTTVTGHAD